jgi:hypothetical protein
MVQAVGLDQQAVGMTGRAFGSRSWRRMASIMGNPSKKLLRACASPFFFLLLGHACA